VNRRRLRVLAPLALLLALMAVRAAACRGKGSAGASHAAPTPAHWVTPLMTAPPPRPTVTLWKGVTRAPALPE